MRYLIGVGVAAFAVLIAQIAGLPHAYGIVAFFGASVGAVELAGRYRYAPARAIFTPSAFIYVLVNIAAAVGVYYLITDGGFYLKEPPAKNNVAELKSWSVTNILAASFGSAFVLRSSLFRVKIGDGEVGVGPSAILDTLLLVADRGVDRAEAAERAREVSRLIRADDGSIVVHADRVADTLTEYALALMQNVAPAERIVIRKQIDEIVTSKTINPEVKADVAALTLANIVGLGVLEATVTALKERAKKANDVGQDAGALQQKPEPTAARDELLRALGSAAASSSARDGVSAQGASSMTTSATSVGVSAAASASTSASTSASGSGSDQG